jgi:pimeloyl-ACP methyl ester carboxylesterase
MWVTGGQVDAVSLEVFIRDEYRISEPREMTNGDWTIQFIRANGIQFGYLEAGEGPLVICLHGFPDTPWSFRPLLTRLAGKGFRAIAPFLRGYAPTDLSPNDDYSLLTLGRDVIALIEHFGAPLAYVVGHDWGAAIAYAAAGLRPDRIRRIVTAAVPHPRHFLLHPSGAQIRASSYMLKFQFAGWAERRVRANDFEWLVNLMQRWSPGWRITEADLVPVKAALSDPRRLRAALRYYRAIPGTVFRAEAWETLLRPARVPVRQIYGEQDGCVLPATFQGAEHLYSAGFDTVGIAGAGHFMHIEKPDEFADRVIEFLRAG